MSSGLNGLILGQVKVWLKWLKLGLFEFWFKWVEIRSSRVLGQMVWTEFNRTIVVIRAGCFN